MEPSKSGMENVKQIVLTKPGKPKASNVAHDSIHLEWMKPKEIAIFSVHYYSVYYHSTKQCVSQWMEYELTGTTDEKMLVANLQEETTYYFKVQAYYEYGGVGLESEVSDPIQTTKPFKPTAFCISHDKVRMEWSKAQESTIKYYTVNYDSNKEPSNGIWTEYKTKATDETTYYLKVKAYYKGGSINLETQSYVSACIPTDHRPSMSKGSCNSHNQIQLESARFSVMSLTPKFKQPISQRTKYTTGETLLVSSIHEGAAYCTHCNDGVFLKSDESGSYPFRSTKPYKRRALCDQIQLESIKIKPHQIARFRIEHYTSQSRKNSVGQHMQSEYETRSTCGDPLVSNLKKGATYHFKVDATNYEGGIRLVCHLVQGRRLVPTPPDKLEVSRDKVQQVPHESVKYLYKVSIKRLVEQCKFGATDGKLLVPNLQKETFKIKIYDQCGVVLKSYISNSDPLIKILSAMTSKSISTSTVYIGWLQCIKPESVLKHELDDTSPTFFYSINPVHFMNEVRMLATRESTILVRRSAGEKVECEVSELTTTTPSALKVKHDLEWTCLRSEQDNYNNSYAYDQWNNSFCLLQLYMKTNSFLNDGMESDIRMMVLLRPGKPLASNVTYDSIQLEWTKPKESAGFSVKYYTIYYHPRNKPVGHWTEFETVASEEKIVVTNLQEGTTYYFKVQAYYEHGGIGLESHVSYPIQTIKSFKVHASQVYHNQVKLEWTPPKRYSISIMYYKVYYRSARLHSDHYPESQLLLTGKQPREHWTEYKTGVTDEILFILKLQEETTYYFKVEAYTKDGIGLESDVSDPIQTKKLVPQKPGKPTALCISHDRIQLEWKKPQKSARFSIKYYTIYYHPLVQCVKKWIKHGSEATDNTLLVINLQKETTYFFKVQAHYKDNGIGLESETSDSIQTTKPYKPIPLRISHDHVLLEWTKPQLSARFNLQCYTISIKPWFGQRIICESGVTDEAIIVSNLQQETTYNFKVKACYECGIAQESDVSDPIRTKQLVPRKPGKPRASCISHDRIQLEWEKPWESARFSIKYYTIYYHPLVQCVKKWIKHGSEATDNTLLVLNLHKETTYFFKVQAHYKDNGIGLESETSDSIQTTKPYKPIPLRISHDHVLLEWTKPQLSARLNLQCYKIYIMPWLGQRIKCETGEIHDALLASGLQEETTYYFKVTACYECGIEEESDVSDPVRSKKLVPLKTGKPTALNVTHNSVLLKWTKPEVDSLIFLIDEDIVSYVIAYHSIDHQQREWIKYEYKATTDHQVLLSKLLPNTTYIFKIQPQYGCSVGIESINDPITTKLTSKPGKPSPLKVNEDSIELQWTKPKEGADNITSYTIFYISESKSDSSTSVEWNEQRTHSHDERAVVDELLDRTTYYFKVRPNCYSGIGQDSDESEPVTTKMTIPSKPGKPTATIDSYLDGIQLEWTKPEKGAHNVTSYTVFYHSSKDRGDQWQKTKLSSGGNRVVMSQLSKGATYCFKVKPECDAGEGVESDISEPVEIGIDFSRDQKLTSNNMKLIFEKAYSTLAASKWYNIGIQLDISDGDLEIIRLENYYDIRTCYLRMLCNWLKQGKASWDKLIAALRHETVGLVDLAESIDQELGKQETECDSSDKEEAGLILFKCPCGDCTLQQFCGSRCPTSIDARFPFIVTDKLNQREKRILHKKLMSDTKSIMEEYSELIQHMRRSFINIDIDNVVSFVIDEYPDTTLMALSNAKIDRKEVNSFNDIANFLQQNSYISFFNHKLVKKLIDKFSTSKELRDKMDEYEAKFNEFCKRSIFEVPKGSFGDVRDENEELIFKVTEKMLETLNSYKKASDMSGEEVLRLQEMIAHALGLDDSVPLLFIEANKGCVELIFSVPEVVMDTVRSELDVSETQTFSSEISEHYHNATEPETPEIIESHVSTETNSSTEFNPISDKSKLAHREKDQPLHSHGHSNHISTAFRSVDVSDATKSSQSNSIKPPQVSTIRSKISNLALVGVHIKCGPPGKPFSTRVTSDSICLQWTKPEYQGTYQVQYYCVHYKSDADKTGKLKALQTETSGSTIEVIRLLQRDSPFIFKVRAINHIGAGVESEQSDPIHLLRPPNKKEFTKQDNNELTLPTKSGRTRGHGEDKKPLQAKPSIRRSSDDNSRDIPLPTEDDNGDWRPKPVRPRAVSVSQNSIRLRWTKPKQSITFSTTVLYQTSEDHPAQWMEQKTSNGESVLVSHLSEMTTYYFKLRFVCETGYCLESDISEPVKTLMCVPSKPGKPKAFNVTYDSIEIEWAKPEQGAHNVHSYTVYYHPPNVACSTTSTTQEKVLVSELSENTTYYFKIQPEYSCGCGPKSNVSEPIKTKQILPSKPGKPVALFIDHDTIQLMWTKPKVGAHNVTSYIVSYYSTSDDQCMSQKTTEESTRVTHLSDMTTYYFKIKPECETGYGLESDLSESMTTLMLIPSKPGKPNATNVTFSSIELEWTKPDQGAHNVTSYTVYFHSINQDNTPNEWIKERTTDESITVSRLLEHTTYMFMIQPECDVDYGALSDLSEPIITETIVPTKPGKPTASHVTLNSIKLDWTKPKQGAHNITSYTIRFYSIFCPNQWIERKAKSSEESILVTQLSQNTTYFFKVHPECETVDAPESDISEPIKTKQLIYSKPGKPKASNITHNSIDLVWTKPESNAHVFIFYSILYNSNASSPTEWIRHEPDPTEERTFVSNLAENTTYIFKIQAGYKDAIGLESVSDPITTKVVVPTEPGKPTASCVTFNSIELKWTKPIQGAHNITHYTVSYRLTDDQQWKNLKTKNDDVLFVLSPLLEQTTYFVKVKAEYEDGSGMESDISEPIVTDLMTPGKPGKPTVTAINCTSVQLKWTKPEYGAHNITSYVIFYRPICDHSDNWRKENVSGQIQTATIGELKPNTVFVFKICAECKKGLGPESKLSDHVQTEVSLGQKVKESGSVHEYYTYSTTETDKKSFKGNNETQQMTIQYRYSTTKTRKKEIKVCMRDLPIQEIMRNEAGNVVRYLVDTGQSNKSKMFKQSDERVFLIVGITDYFYNYILDQDFMDSVISAMANFILGVHWQHEFQFSLNSDSENSQITMYTFQPMEGSQISYSVTLICTPEFDILDDYYDGFDHERNKGILRNIKDLFFIENKKNVDKIHGIGLFINKYVDDYLFDCLLTVFGKDIIPNIIVLTTNSDVQEPQWLLQMESKDNYSDHLKLKFIRLCTEPVDNEDLWKEKASGFKNLFAAIKEMKPKTFSVLKKRLRNSEHLLNSNQWYPYYVSELGSMIEQNATEPSYCISKKCSKSPKIDDSALGTRCVVSGLVEPGMSQLYTVSSDSVPVVF